MAGTTVNVQMQQRRDTAAGWTAANPTLLNGELGYETDTRKFKIGNGSTAWASLPYLPIPDGSGELDDDITITGDLTVGGDLTLEGQADLRFADADSSNWVAFQAPATISDNVTWTLPDADTATAGYALVSDAAGTLSWGKAGGAAGGGTNSVFYENDQTVTDDYELSTNVNAMSAGPITINSGVVVTIGSGQVWTIV